jgi:hypothetical protein
MMNFYTAMNWIMFLGMFPLAFFWLRRAWLIGIRKDYSYVALKRGKPPENPEKYWFPSTLLNLISGIVIAVVIFQIIIAGISYETWTAISGITIWMKLFGEFILSRHAHSIFKKK